MPALRYYLFTIICYTVYLGILYAVRNINMTRGLQNKVEDVYK